MQVVFVIAVLLRPVIALCDSCDTTTFSLPQYYTTNGAYDVVTGDFNRDGKQDFVVNNAFSGIVFLGDGRGGFPISKPFSVGSGFHESITAGDLNGDGYPDVVLPNYPDPSISVLLNDGAGGFGAASVFATGDLPRHIAVGDFNGDEKPDLAVVNGGSANVSILLGNGSGGFGAASNFPVGAGPNAIVIRDFNEDGNLDLSVSTYDSEKLKILFGDGTGDFTAGGSYPLGGNSFAIATGDFNHDGHSDLAVGVNNIYPNNHVAIFLGNGKGIFTQAPDVLVYDVVGLAIADFNLDGELDIAVATYDGTVAIAFGDGTGAFSPVTEYHMRHLDNPLGIAAADFNGDGKPDLVTANYGNSDASVLLNVPKVHITAPDASAAEPGSDTGTFRVTRNGCTADSLTVHYAVSGTATPRNDYKALCGKVTIPAGKSGVTITVVPLNDTTPEPTETVTVSLTHNPYYFVGGQSSATVTITDDD